MMSTNRLDSFSILTSQQYCATFCNPNIFHLFLTLCMLKGCSFSRPFQWCIFQGLKGCSYFDEGRQRLAFFCHRNWHFYTKIVLLIGIPLEVETRKINFSQLRQTSRAALCTKHWGWNQSSVFKMVKGWRPKKPFLEIHSRYNWSCNYIYLEYVEISEDQSKTGLIWSSDPLLDIHFKYIGLVTTLTWSKETYLRNNWSYDQRHLMSTLAKNCHVNGCT